MRNKSRKASFIVPHPWLMFWIVFVYCTRRVFCCMIKSFMYWNPGTDISHGKSRSCGFYLLAFTEVVLVNVHVRKTEIYRTL